MDFHLTKEQLLVRKMYRDFAETMPIIRNTIPFARLRSGR